MTGSGEGSRGRGEGGRGGGFGTGGSCAGGGGGVSASFLALFQPSIPRLWLVLSQNM